MKFRMRHACCSVNCILGMVLMLFLSLSLSAQGRGGQAPSLTPKAAASVDLTGYWVSVVTEDWRWRMLTPPKGSFPSVPLNAEGRRIANAWDPAKDEAEGNECKAYGAAAILRMPTRLHVTWEDDNTLHIDTDAGSQTRRFHFGQPQPPAEASWQGYSAAAWEFAGPAGDQYGVGKNRTPGGALKVVTSHMKPGYLQKNGVPYSGNAVVTEYFDVAKAPNGDTWLLVTTIVDDPAYLAVAPSGAYGDQYGPFIRTTNFKHEPDGSKWNPTPCSAR